MYLLAFAKGALAMFWLVAVLNLISPFAAPLHGWLNWAAGLMLLAHLGEMLLFQARLQARPQPWLERAQVMLFGFLHLRGLPKV